MSISISFYTFLFFVSLLGNTNYNKQASENIKVPEAAVVKIPAGYYKPFYKTEGTDSVKVSSFEMDVYPVTNRQYLAFVKENIKYSKSRISGTFADKGYLKHWKSDFEIGDTSLLDRPVTNVSWFAAKAYCKWKGKRLPTVYEWEYAANVPLVWPIKAKGIEKNEVILKWYGKPNPAQFPKVGTVNKNAYGLYDLYGSVWEWVLDFNSIVIANDPRGGLDLNNFCGSGAFGALDAKDYATFMRFAMRSSLKASYTVENLGFRCVKDI